MTNNSPLQSEPIWLAEISSEISESSEQAALLAKGSLADTRIRPSARALKDVMLPLQKIKIDGGGDGGINVQVTQVPTQAWSK